SIYQYNATLARFEWAKGTILLHDNVQIQEGPLPECAREWAVENQRRKEHALKICDRAGADAYRTGGGAACGCAAGAPIKTPESTLKGVFESMPPVGEDRPQIMPPLPDAKLEESKLDDK